VYSCGYVCVCIRVCVYIYTHTRMHTHTYPQEYTCTSAWHHPNTLKNGYWLGDSKSMDKNSYTYIYICIYMHALTYTYTHADIYIYACSYTHIHTHIYTHTYNMYLHVHKYAWNDGAAATAWEARLDATRAPQFSSRSGSASSLRRDLFHEKWRVSAKTVTNHTDSISSHHHDSAPPRLQLLICANPPSSWPAQGARHGVDPSKRGYVSAIIARFLLHSRGLNVHGASTVLRKPLWSSGPQLRLILPSRFPAWSGYTLGSGSN